LFSDVRSCEAFKHLHLGMLSSIPRKTQPAIAQVVGLAIDILSAVKTGIPKPHDLGFCFLAVAFTDLLCSGLTLAPQTDTASPAAKMFLLALMSRSW